LEEGHQGNLHDAFEMPPESAVELPLQCPEIFQVCSWEWAGIVLQPLLSN